MFKRFVSTKEHETRTWIACPVHEPVVPVPTYHSLPLTPKPQLSSPHCAAHPGRRQCRRVTASAGLSIQFGMQNPLHMLPQRQYVEIRMHPRIAQRHSVDSKYPASTPQEYHLHVCVIHSFELSMEVALTAVVALVKRASWAACNCSMCVCVKD
jgi:hypothetical protein